jgi:hypothetical protein
MTNVYISSRAFLLLTRLEPQPILAFGAAYPWAKPGLLHVGLAAIDI